MRVIIQPLKVFYWGCNVRTYVGLKWILNHYPLSPSNSLSNLDPFPGFSIYVRYNSQSSILFVQFDIVPPGNTPSSLSPAAPSPWTATPPWARTSPTTEVWPCQRRPTRRGWRRTEGGRTRGCRRRSSRISSSSTWGITIELKCTSMIFKPRLLLVQLTDFFKFISPKGNRTVILVLLLKSTVTL